MASALQRTASTHMSAVIRGAHEFQIVGYRARKSLARVTDSSSKDAAAPLHAGGAPCTIKSKPFQVGGYAWHLVCTFYDKGDRHLKSVTLEMLSAFIVPSDVIATASLRIDDPLGRWPPAVWKSDTANTFSWKAQGRSWKLSLPDAFRGHEDRYVSTNDRLTILCTVEVFKENAATAAEPTKCFVSPVPPPTIAGEFRKLLLLLETSCLDTSDVTFIVEGTQIFAHRLVLAMRSPVFAAELLRHMRESTTRCVKIHDMSAPTFSAMLRFIYTDEFPINSSDSMVRDLLVAADRYDLGRLRLMCENILVKSINIMTVIPILLLVRGRGSCHQLEDSCIEYIASDPDVYAAVRATEGYKELKETCSSFIIEVTERIATHNMSRRTSSPSSSIGSRPPPEKSMSIFNSSVVVRGTHEFRIPNFSSVQRRHGTHQAIPSDTFKVGGYDWKMTVYPSGFSTVGGGNSGKYISVFLDLGTDPGTASIKLYRRFRIDDPTGKGPSTILASEVIYTKASRSWGNRQFITLKSAKSRYMGHDGSLTIHCDIDLTKEACTTSTKATAIAAPRIIVPPSNIASQLEQLFVSGQWSNVTFHVEGSEIHAHWLIIAVRSPDLFFAVVPSTTKRGMVPKRVIQITNMKAAVLRAVIHFVYTDELPPVNDAVVAGEMLAAARRFRLERMKAMCENLVSQLVTKGNALSMLELAWRHRCKELKLYCTEFISHAMK
jgi:speckle-type POZ protein